MFLNIYFFRSSVTFVLEQTVQNLNDIKQVIQKKQLMLQTRYFSAHGQLVDILDLNYKLKKNALFLLLLSQQLAFCNASQFERNLHFYLYF